MAKTWREEHTLKDDRTLPIFVHSVIDDMTHLPPNTMRVYIHLVRRADKSGVAWPSYQAIADHCFASISENPATRKSFARKAIDHLVEAGLIHKEIRSRDDGSQSSNAYVLIDPCLLSTPMPIKHPHANSADPMPNTQGPCLSSTKDNSIEGSPLKVTGIISSSDPWAICLAELLPTLSGVGKSYLTGSHVEAIGVVDGVELYRIVIEPRAAPGIEWLSKQVGHSVRRTLGSILRKSINVEFVAAEPAQVTVGEDRP